MVAKGSAAKGPNYRWVILGTICLVFFSAALVFQGIPPILSLIIADLQLSHAEAGLLMSLFALTGVFLSIPIGIVSDRYGPRYLIIISLASMIVGSLLVAGGQSFPILLLGRVIAGIGGFAVFMIGPQVVAQWFVGRELGRAVGIYTTIMPLGAIISLNTLGTVAEAIGWQGSVLISVAVSLVALAVFLALHRPAPSTPDGHSRRTEQSPFRAISKLGTSTWLVGVIWMMFNLAVISFLTFGPDYFVTRGYSIEAAGFLASILMLLSPPLAPLCGYLIDRFGREEVFVAAGGLLLAGGILLVPLLPDEWLALPLISLSIGAALVPTPVFYLPPKLVSPHHLGTAFGVISTFLNASIVIGPYITGLARDATGSYQVSFFLMSFFSLLVTAIAPVLYLIRRRANGW
ncbi:MAG: MFS transporter [Chloroflexi bacterium]|nr:MFS transporter [Chloroflexota bacterium]